MNDTPKQNPPDEVGIATDQRISSEAAPLIKAASQNVTGTLTIEGLLNIKSGNLDFGQLPGPLPENPTIKGTLTIESGLGNQGGHLELSPKIDTIESPCIDFHYGLGSVQDYNVRLINADDNRLDFVTESGGPVLSIYTDRDRISKVGIGTTNPSAKLVVNDPFAGAELRVDGVGGAYGLSLGADADHPWMGTRTNHDLRIVTNGTEKVRVSANGNVGIGTTTPSEKLEIRGGKLRVGDTQIWDNEINRYNNDTLYIGYQNTANTILQVNGGKVGIGTADLKGKLSIHSTIEEETGLFITSTKSNKSDAMINVTLLDKTDFTHRLFTSRKRNSTLNAWLDWTFELDKGDEPGIQFWRAFRPDGQEPSFARILHLAWNGNIGIGTTSPQHPLHMGGGAFCENGRIWRDGSSREYKKAITPLVIDQALETLANLNPVTFTYKDEPEDKRHVGFIAEEVPELVAAKDRKGLSAMDIVGILTKVVQHLHQEIVELKRKT